MKIFVYLEGTPLCSAALRTAGHLAHRLATDLVVMTSRTGTVVNEPQPPLGQDVPRDAWQTLPPGVALLTRALKELEAIGALNKTDAIRVREEAGDVRVFRVPMATGQTATFQMRFGSPLATIETAVEHGGEDDLLVIADPGKRGLHRLVTTNLAHRAALETMVSVLAVKGDHLDGRVVLCADGSKSARRAFPILRPLLPAVGDRVDVLGVRERRAEEIIRETCIVCAERARGWLTAAGKQSEVIIREGERAEDVILDEAGDDCLLVMGASLRSDLARRLKGSVPLHVMERGLSSVLLAKCLPEKTMPLPGRPEAPLPRSCLHPAQGGDGASVSRPSLAKSPPFFEPFESGGVQMLVKYAMEREPLRVATTAPLRTILEALLSSNQDAAMVVDEKGNLLGLVGIHDILRRIVPSYLDLDDNLAKVMHEGYFDEVFNTLVEVTAADLMSPGRDVDTVSPDDTVIKAAVLFVEHRRKVLPVVEGRRVVGTITRRSILRRALEKLG